MSFSKDRTNYFRSQLLLVDGGALVVRKVFNHHIPATQQLCKFLALKETQIKELRKKKVISEAQYVLLFPDIGNPSSENFDLTLLICLLRNVCGLNTNYQWKGSIEPKDTSLEADLHRLRDFRNKLCHSTTTSMQDSEFNELWGDIEQVLRRLNSNVSDPVPDLEGIFKSFKTEAVSTDSEKHLKEQIENWKTMDSHVLEMEREIKETQREVKETRNEVKETKKEVKEIQTGQEELMQRVQSLEEKEPTAAHASAYDREYEELKKWLKEDLMEFNSFEHSTISCSPIADDNDVPLTKLYVIPEMISVYNKAAVNKIKSPINSLQELFWKNGKRCGEIYVTADAGLGKTAFSKRLTVTWCEAHRDGIQEDDAYDAHQDGDSRTISFSDDDIRTMKNFEFLFVIPLRDSRDCYVDDMIRNQVLCRLSRSSRFHNRPEFVQDILRKEKCLVILDGLDEWQHPAASKCPKDTWSKPHRRGRTFCTFLTTSRPWKLSVIKLKTSEVQHQVELVGFSKKTSEKLKMNAISFIKYGEESESLKKEIDDFNEEIKRNEIEDLEKIPLMVMYLIGLWCDGRPFGRTKCDLYNNIIELLLNRTEESYDREQKPNKFVQIGDNDETNIRQRYSQLMTALGQLAFSTLFSNTRELKLVFDYAETKEHLSQEFLDFGLSSGIITQNKISGQTYSERKVSFAHKSLQEYFAALYLEHAYEQQPVLTSIQSSCCSIARILEMSKVFIFLSGINANAVEVLSPKLMETVSKDELAHNYRSTATHWYYAMDVKPLKAVQDMIVSCMKESGHGSELRLCLQDFHIDKSCRNVKYRRTLQEIAKNNKGRIESFSIELAGFSNLQEIINSFELNDDQGLQKVYIRGEFLGNEFGCLVSGSEHTLRSLAVISSEWKENNFEEKYSDWSSTPSNMLTKLSQVQAINFDGFKVAHEDFKKILVVLERRNSLKQLILHNIECSVHGSTCNGEELDLLDHGMLKMLRLRNLPLSQIKINASSLKECDVGLFQNPGIVSSFFDQLQHAKNLEKIHCNSLEAPEHIDKMIETFPYLVNLNCIILRRLKTGTRPLNFLSKIEHLTYVQLFGMTVASSVFRELLEALQSLRQPVKVVLKNVTITPEEDSLKIKTFIKDSLKFTLIFDGKTQTVEHKFSFEKIAGAEMTEDIVYSYSSKCC